MIIVCDKTLLSAAIDGVSKAVTMRSSIPVLEGILLKAEGFQLTLTGYDLEMGIVTTIEANIKEPGEIVLNAKLLSSMISRMPAGQISIVAADNGKTTIQSGVAQFEIQSMPATDFPELPNTGAEQTLTIKTGVLRDMIDRTLYAVSQDEKKPAHTGELFEIELDKLTMVALDGYRLAIVERPITAVKDIRIIVPSKTMTEVSHLLANDDEEDVHISASRRYVVFTPAGSTWPYGRDPQDSNVRIAPSFASAEEIEPAARLFTISVRLATLEKLAATRFASETALGAERIA